ncbi:Transcription termination factor like [Quillaja saponaria]|uniref:Transcription termination factor like n=1 Tax=Quillaja saponaria TaxID=32244 RepID=A0AAD7PGU0_QUISA|nr:Transcription termination factor like [Quillaja saponaria]
MFTSHCKALLYLKGITVRTTAISQLHFPLLQHNTFTFFVKLGSSTPKQQSFTVSYLVNNCGLSQETALSASKQIQFETSEKPDSVLAFFRNNGFSNTQISRIVKVFPKVLFAKPGKSLRPKLEFFRSKGASSSEILDIVSGWPRLLLASLKNQIIPSYELVKSLLHSDKRTITCLTRNAGIIAYSPLAINIKMLRDNGVPDANIAFLLYYSPYFFDRNPVTARVKLQEVKEMGFSPSRFHFIVAVRVKANMRKSTWQRKVCVYKRWGWSEEAILAAVCKHPCCMASSENKITAVMDIFVNQLGLDSLVLAKRPVVLSLSLKKRIIPRFSVLQFLLSKGLINKNAGLVTPFTLTDMSFLQKFVNHFKEEAPELLKLYEEKLTLSG